VNHNVLLDFEFSFCDIELASGIVDINSSLAYFVTPEDPFAEFTRDGSDTLVFDATLIDNDILHNLTFRFSSNWLLVNEEWQLVLNNFGIPKSFQLNLDTVLDIAFWSGINTQVGEHG